MFNKSTLNTNRIVVLDREASSTPSIVALKVSCP